MRAGSFDSSFSAARRVVHRAPAYAGALFCACAALLLQGRANAEELARYGVDAAEARSLAKNHPSAADELNRGERLLREPLTVADLEQAEALFDKAANEAPRSELIKRRRCQTLTLLGRHADAVKACGQALYERNTSGLALRATVGALMSGSEPVTGTELGYAIIHQSRAKRVLSSEPVGHAGECDMAEKLGDIEMLKGCIQVLRGLAPNHPETLRAEAFLADMQPGARTAAAWVGLVAICLISAAHAWWRRRRAMVATGLAALLGVLSWSPHALAGSDAKPPGAAAALSGNTRKNDASDHGTTADGPAPSAQEGAPIAGHLSKFPIDDANPLASVPTPEQRDGDPIQYGYFIMDLGDHAQWAIDKGDHRTAAKLYAALAKTVPDAAVGFQKACEQYEAVKDIPTALEFCSAALTVPGSGLSDYSHYARLALAQPKLRARDIQNLDAVIRHLKAEPHGVSVALDIECTLGAHEADRARLEDCVPKLAAVAPNNPKTLFYEWALAIQKRDFATAERVLAKAKQTTTAKQQTAEMERATLAAMPAWRKGIRAFRDWRVGLFATGLLALGLTALLLRRGPIQPSSTV